MPPSLMKYYPNNTSFTEIWAVLLNGTLPFAAHVALTQKNLLSHILWDGEESH